MIEQLNIFGGSEKLYKPYVVNDDDIAHIYRYKTLDMLYSKIYELLQLGYSDKERILIKKILVAYPEERQAEVLNTWRMPIKDRVIIHIEVYRKIKKYGKNLFNN